MFLGTPARSKWARQWRLDPKKTDPDGEVAEVASYAEWLASPAMTVPAAVMFCCPIMKTPSLASSLP